MNFAIIGCGRIAQRHAEHIVRRGQLMAVCDIIPERAHDLAARYGARAYISLSDLLSNERSIDVVAVCTPNGLHAEQSIACLEAGLHVLCEKPMALSTADARSMIDAATTNNRLLAIVKQNRFNPPVQALKKLLSNNELGKITSFQLNCFWNRDSAYFEESDWKGTADLDGGILFTQFSHFIDLLYWTLGEVESAQGFAKNFQHGDQLAFEDTGVVALHMKSGAVGTLHYTINAFQKNMEGSLTIFGEKGTVKIGGEYLNTLEYLSLESGKTIALPESASANDYGTYRGSMSNHDKVYDNLLAALHNKEAINASAEDGLKTVEIIHLIKQSLSQTVYA